MLTACLALLTLVPQSDAAKFLDVALAPYQKGPFKISFTPVPGYMCEFSRGKSGQFLSVKGGGEVFEFRSNDQLLVELDVTRKQYYSTESASMFEGAPGEVATVLADFYPGILQLDWVKGAFSQPATKVTQSKTGTVLTTTLNTQEGTVNLSYSFDVSRKPVQYKLVNEGMSRALVYNFGKVVWEVDETTLIPEIPMGYDPIYLPDAPYTIDTDAPWPEMRLTSAATSVPVSLTSQLKAGKLSLLFFGRYDEVIAAQIEAESAFREVRQKFGAKANFVQISMTPKPGSAAFVATVQERRKMAGYAAPMVVLLGKNREVLQMWQGNVENLAKLITDELNAH